MTHLHDYFAELDQRGQAGAIRTRKLAAVKSFFAYLEDTGIIDGNPARGIPRPKQEMREPRVFAEQEYGLLHQACNGHLRDRALMELFLQTGLRLSDELDGGRLGPPRGLGSELCRGRKGHGERAQVPDCHLELEGM